VMFGYAWLCGSGSDITGFDLWPSKLFRACSIFSEEVYLDLLCSSVREPEPEPEPFFEKVGAGAVFQKSYTAPLRWDLDR